MRRLLLVSMFALFVPLAAAEDPDEGTDHRTLRADVQGDARSRRASPGASTEGRGSEQFRAVHPREPTRHRRRAADSTPTSRTWYRRPGNGSTGASCTTGALRSIGWRGPRCARAASNGAGQERRAGALQHLDAGEAHRKPVRAAPTLHTSSSADRKLRAVRAAVLTISSSLARGEGEDVSGPELVACCERAGLEVTHETVSDDREAIAAACAGWPTRTTSGSCSRPAAPA